MTSKRQSQVAVCACCLAHFFNGVETARASRLWGRIAVMGFKGGSASGGGTYSNCETFAPTIAVIRAGVIFSACAAIL